MARQGACEAKLHKYDADVHSSCPWCRPTRPNMAGQPQPAVAPAKPPEQKGTRFIYERSAVAPVVGWLVVVTAPKATGAKEGLSNQGRDYRLVPNRNRIGRDKSCEVCLDYGDGEISGDHCALVYDAVNNMFYLQPGEGRNLTYLLEPSENEADEPRWAPVLAVKELKPRDTIRIGQTRLSLIPFCWPGEFEWDFELSKPRE